MGKKVATTKDKNNNDCATKGANNSLGKRIPTNKLLEKSGVGNIKKPPINPTIIDTYAVFSLIFLLQKLQKTVSTKAQHNKSASKNKYKISNPLDATIKEINDKNKIIYLETFK